MNVISRGFSGRRRPGGEKLPPGQYLETGFPVLSAGPTPPVKTATWQFTITTETGETRRWDWQQFMSLPAEQITTDIHCVTKWSKLGTHWRGVLTHASAPTRGWAPTPAGCAAARRVKATFRRRAALNVAFTT